MTYVIRYEDIEFDAACDILRKYGGYFDADGRVLVVPDSLDIKIEKSGSEIMKVFSEARMEARNWGYHEGKWVGDLDGFDRGYKKGLRDMRRLKELWDKK